MVLQEVEQPPLASSIGDAGDAVGDAQAGYTVIDGRMRRSTATMRMSVCIAATPRTSGRC